MLFELLGFLFIILGKVGRTNERTSSIKLLTRHHQAIARIYPPFPQEKITVLGTMPLVLALGLKALLVDF